MEIGTIETLEDNEEPGSKKSPGRVRNPGAGQGGPDDGGHGGDDGKGGNGSGGGSKRPGKRPLVDPSIESAPEKSRILMWFLLLVVLMTFGGLIGAYVVISTNAALEWRPFQLPGQIWISTVVLLVSSLTYHFSRRALSNGQFGMAKKLLLGTSALGGIFISSQILSWMALVERGLYMTGNPYAGFFYILTAVHAVHVLGGICALGYLTLRTWETPSSYLEEKSNNTDATVVGWYWHTMDGLWLVLIFLLGFFK
jgi:cytochrome c oxidase subunit 3